MSSDHHQASPPDGRRRGKYWWVRWAILAVAVVVLTVELVLVWDQLAKAWKSLLSANGWWVLAAVAGHAERRAIRLGLRGQGVVEVEDGLAEGDVVILPSSGPVQAGAKIRL